MDKAKAAVSDFLHKDGKHDTTVHESVAPAVQHETVKPQHHTQATTAIDREIHQDHYHTSVQPVHDREVLPEQHHHKLGEVEHRHHDHRDHEHTKNHLATEAAKFKDQQTVVPTAHTQSAAPVVGGEHVHHHIHETIQPIVHKETVQPHVTHHTKPIHETHHHAAQHHSSTELPAVSMADFKNKGGVLGGRGEKYDAFEGEPRGLSGLTGNHSHGHKHDSAHTDAAGAVGAGAVGTEAAHHHNKHNTTDSHHHHNTAGTVGAGALGAEAAHHHNKHNNPDSHHHNTAGTVGAGALGAEAAHHHHNKHNPTGTTTTGTGAGLTNERGLANDNYTGTTGTSGQGLSSGYSNLTGSHANNDSNLLSSHANQKGSGLTGTKHHPVGDLEPGTNRIAGDVANDASTTTKKPSLVDRLNPMKHT